MSRTVGTPTWIDFGSNDFAASKAFYEQLFGWEFADGGEEFGHYNMITKDGALVGGGMDVSAMTCPDGGPIPSSWDVYLAVDDVDARVQKAVAAGAQIIVEPADAGPAGRFAMALDPSHASIGFWKGGDTEGYAFSGKPGTPIWFELMTQDFDAASKFYTEVFDFNLVPMGPAGRYVTNGGGDDATSGLCNAKEFIPAEMGSFWRVYFAVESCDPAVTKVQELGGKLLDGPDNSPFGRIATVADPAGAMFQLCAPSEAVEEG